MRDDEGLVKFPLCGWVVPCKEQKKKSDVNPNLLKGLDRHHSLTLPPMQAVNTTACGNQHESGLIKEIYHDWTAQCPWISKWPTKVASVLVQSHFLPTEGIQALGLQDSALMPFNLASCHLENMQGGIKAWKYFGLDYQTGRWGEPSFTISSRYSAEMVSINAVSSGSKWTKEGHRNHITGGLIQAWKCATLEVGVEKQHIWPAFTPSAHSVKSKKLFF